MFRRLLAWLRRVLIAVAAAMIALEPPDRAPLFSRPAFVPPAWSAVAP